MKAQEKELIYNLLKKASDNFYGYCSPDFSNENINFSDDIIEIENTTKKITSTLKITKLDEDKKLYKL